jgi:hypothetical protein
MRTLSGSKTCAVGLSVAAAVAAVLAFSAQADGALITGVGAAELMTEGTYSGWYKYTYMVTWDLTKALSHLDLLMPDCGAQDGIQFAFDTAVGGDSDGQSTGGKYHEGQPVVFTVRFDGGFEPRGDPSLSLGTPLIKWEPNSSHHPGKYGVGQFWFYSDAAPTTGTFEDSWVAKFGSNEVRGDLTGAYPARVQPGPRPVPEPATLAYLVIGAVATVVARVRRRGRRGGNGGR